MSDGTVPKAASRRRGIWRTCTYGGEGLDDNVEFDEDRESEDEKDIDVDEL
jgi:hypothetical protein